MRRSDRDHRPVAGRKTISLAKPNFSVPESREYGVQVNVVLRDGLQKIKDINMVG